MLALLVGAAFAGTVTSLIPEAFFLWLGVPVAVLLGWALGPAAADERSCTALRMAWGCTVFGALLTGILLAAVNAWAPDPELQAVTIVAQGLFFGLLGIAIFGIPAVLILWGVASIWAVLVCNVVDGPPASGMQEAPA